MAQDYTTLEQCMTYLKNLINSNKVSLGIKFVDIGDIELIPEYPAVLITGGPVTTEIHGTHKFLNYFNAYLWIYHAKLTVGRTQRTLEDMALVTAVRTLLHSDKTLGGHIVFGFCDSQEPGILSSRERGDAVIGTRMTWNGQNREMYT